MFDHTIVVHKGWEHVPIYITNHMVDHKLENFTPTPRYSRKSLPQRKKEKNQTKTFEWM